MKRILFVLLLSACGGAGDNVYGAEFLIEKGQATVLVAATNGFVPATYTAIALRSDGQIFGEAIQGSWIGKNRAQFAAISAGYKSKGKFFSEYAIGGVKLFNPETDLLDGDKQIMLTVGIGGKFDNLITTVRLRHFSNAGTKGDNAGFEIIGFSFGATF